MLKLSHRYFPVLGRLMLGISQSPVDLRSGGMMSVNGHLRCTGEQELEKTDMLFALLLDVLNDLSLTTGLQRLHLPTNALGTS